VNDTNSKTNSKREPFCWIEKRKLRMIGDVFSEKAGRSSSARSLYLALCEIASDRQRDRFDVSQPEIATRAGLSVATAKRILPVVGQLGLVKIKRNSIRGIEVASTYTIVRGPLAHHELAPAHLPKSKRATKKQSFEESSEGTARRERVLSSSTRGSSLAEEDGEIVIDEKTGERKNKKTGEYEW
jgi:hypothetical protein